MHVRKHTAWLFFLQKKKENIPRDLVDIRLFPNIYDFFIMIISNLKIDIYDLWKQVIYFTKKESSFYI